MADLSFGIQTDLPFAVRLRISGRKLMRTVVMTLSTRLILLTWICGRLRGISTFTGRACLNRWKWKMKNIKSSP